MLKKQHQIVALDRPQKPKRLHSLLNSLILSLKKGNLELSLYSSLDPKVMNKILEKYYHDQPL